MQHYNEHKAPKKSADVKQDNGWREGLRVSELVEYSHLLISWPSTNSKVITLWPLPQRGSLVYKVPALLDCAYKSWQYPYFHENENYLLYK